MLHTYIKKDIKDYFLEYLNLISSMMPKDKALTHKEKMFYTECLYFNYKGGNLGDITALKEYFKSIKFFSRLEDVSTYKYKLSVKFWIESGRDKFIIPEGLDIKEGEDAEFILKVKFVK